MEDEFRQLCLTSFSSWSETDLLNDHQSIISAQVITSVLCNTEWSDLNKPDQIKLSVQQSIARTDFQSTAQSQPTSLEMSIQNELMRYLYPSGSKSNQLSRDACINIRNRARREFHASSGQTKSALLVQLLHDYQLLPACTSNPSTCHIPSLLGTDWKPSLISWRMHAESELIPSAPLILGLHDLIHEQLKSAVHTAVWTCDFTSIFMSLSTNFATLTVSTLSHILCIHSISEGMESNPELVTFQFHMKNGVLDPKDLRDMSHILQFGHHRSFVFVRRETQGHITKLKKIRRDFRVPGNVSVSSDLVFQFGSTGSKRAGRHSHTTGSQNHDRDDPSRISTAWISRLLPNSPVG